MFPFEKSFLFTYNVYLPLRNTKLSASTISAALNAHHQNGAPANNNNNNVSILVVSVELIALLFDVDLTLFVWWQNVI